MRDIPKINWEAQPPEDVRSEQRILETLAQAARMLKKSQRKRTAPPE